MIEMEEITGKVFDAARLLNSTDVKAICNAERDTFLVVMGMMIDMHHSATGEDPIETAGNLYEVVSLVNEQLGPIKAQSKGGNRKWYVTPT